MRRQLLLLVGLLGVALSAGCPWLKPSVPPHTPLTPVQLCALDWSALPSSASTGPRADAFNIRRISFAILSILVQPHDFAVEEGEVANAVATLQGVRRHVIYQPAFLGSVNELVGSPWAVHSILAHEFAHHIQGHTLQRGLSNKYLELEADEHAGNTMAQMSVPLEEATRWIAQLNPEKSGATHPGRAERIAAMTKGWKEGTDRREKHELKNPLRDQLIERLGGRPEELQLNVPAGLYRYPGSTFLLEGSWIMLDPAQRDNTLLRVSNPFPLPFSNMTDLLFDQTSIVLDGLAGLELDLQAVSVKIQIKDARLLEMDGVNLKRRILGSETTQRAASRGSNPLVITSAYEGRFSARITPKPGTPAAAFKKVVEKARSTQGPNESKVTIAITGDPEDEITVTAAQPSVFAFRIANADFLSTSLGPMFDTVNLRPMSVRELMELKKKQPEP